MKAHHLSLSIAAVAQIAAAQITYVDLQGSGNSGNNTTVDADSPYALENIASPNGTDLAALSLEVGGITITFDLAAHNAGGNNARIFTVADTDTGGGSLDGSAYPVIKETLILRNATPLNFTISGVPANHQLTMYVVQGMKPREEVAGPGASWTFNGGDPVESIAIAQDNFELFAGSFTDLNLFTSIGTAVGRGDIAGSVTRPNNTFNHVLGGFAFELSPLSGLGLSVSHDSGADMLEFRWESQTGKVYDLLSSTDPETDGDPDTWVAVPGQEDIAAIPPTNVLTITRPADGKRFYVIREKDAPPPPPIFEDDFENGGAGWSTSNDGVAGTDWVLGDPTGGINNGPPSAFSPDNCYGTNILTDYGGEADVSLISPSIAIPAGGAILTYQFWIDTETGPIPDPPDFGTLNILDADNGDVLLETLEAEVLGFPLAWDLAEHVLPASAHGKNVKFQFRFVSDAGGVNSNFGGWYIDDVAVVATPNP